MSRLTAIDLFSGVGGLALGFEQAGFDILAAVEIDPVHCAVHRYNFPETGVIPRSVSRVGAAEVRAIAGLGNREIDCVFGGPPCQGFSLIGHRVFDDPRNSLVLDFVRLVADLRARTFVFENVKGLTIGRHKAFLRELIEEFDRAGYEVRLPWQVLNAENYSVPQHRERLILIGARKGSRVPTYPKLQTVAADGEATLDGEVGPTCFDAIGDLPDADLYERLLEVDEVGSAAFGYPTRYAAELRGQANGSWHFGHVRNWNPQVLTASARTLHSEISRRRFSETRPGEVEPISRFYKLDKNGLSNTLRAGTDGARGAFTSPRPIHYEHPRCVTVREMARLHGFPDWFRLHATKWHGARQVGNAVPPPLARAIALCVSEALGCKPEPSRRVLDLGDPALLTMDLSAASDYFGVEAPPSRRDRKSGARKRKQSEIERDRLSELSLNEQISD